MRTPDSYSGYCEKTTFRKFGYRIRENRDLRQLLWHRHRLVQMRTRITNQLHALAMNEGYRWKKKLFSEPGRAQLEKLALAPWASRRRRELLELLDRLNPTIEELSAAVGREVRKRPEAMRLLTHPGVGPLTALAYVLIIGTPMRFQCGKQIGTYVGMIPCEESLVLASSDLDISASRVIRCCASCWWKQPKQRHVSIPTGDAGTCTWRCVDTKALPR